MEHPHEPINVIQEWQDWYKNNQDKHLFQKQAINSFADTITEFSSCLTGSELFECLLIAATDQLNYTKDQYDRANQFVSLLRCDGFKK